MLVKSINYWSFPGGLEGSLDPVEAARLAKDAGFEAIELCIGDAGTSLGIDASDNRVAEIRREVEALGLTVPSVASGLYWSRALGDADAGARQQAQEDLRQMIRISAGLGARTLLTIPGAVEVFFLPERPVQPYEEVHRNATEGLRAVLPTAEQYEVRLGIENVWNRFLLSPMEMASFIDGFGSRWIGAYVDVANILPYGFPDQWLRVLGSRVVGVHFKDFRRAVGTIEGFVDLLEGDVDWPGVTKALEDIRYEGPVVGEMIPLYRHFPLVRVANTSRAMDAILGRG
jgi:hexulose-6-phosphate isomerase